jgi:hypothetical protein
MSDLMTGETAPEGNENTNTEETGKTFEVPSFLSGVEGIEELGEEILTSPSLSSIKDLGGLVKNYVNTKRMVGEDKVIIPNDKSTDADREDFWRKLGKPESEKDFNINLPEETIVEKEFYDSFKSFAFQNNILPNQANAMVEFMEQYEGQMNEKFGQEAKERQEAEIAALKDEWSEAFEGKINLVNTVIKEFADDDIMSHMKNTGLVNDTKLAKLFANVAEVLYKEKKLDTPAPSTGLTKDQAISKYNELKKSDAYWNKGHVDHSYVLKEVEKLLPFVHGQ